MNKKILGIIVLIIIILAFILYYFFYMQSKDTFLTKYYIYLNSDSDYLLEIDETGQFKLVVQSMMESEEEMTKRTYQSTFVEDEFVSIKYILNNFNSKYHFDSNEEYLFYFSNDTDYETLESDDLKVLEKLLEAIYNISLGKEEFEGTTRRNYGNNQLGAILQKIDIEEYEKIKLKNMESGEIIQLNGENKTIEIKDNKLFVENNETIMQNSSESFSIADLDNDGIVEIITITVDNTIAPPNNTTHIYKYIDNNFKEILTFSIMGSYDTIYIKEQEIKIIYEPYGGAPGFVASNQYTLE